jgi:hypothetical protein
MRSWWQGTWLVASRTLTEQLRSRSFKVVTGLLLLVSVAAIVVPQVIGEDDTTYTLATVGDVPRHLKGALQASQASGDFTVEFTARDDRGGVRRAVRDGDATAGLVGSTLYVSDDADGTFPVHCGERDHQGVSRRSGGGRAGDLEPARGGRADARGGGEGTQRHATRAGDSRSRRRRGPGRGGFRGRRRPLPGAHVRRKHDRHDRRHGEVDAHLGGALGGAASQPGRRGHRRRRRDGDAAPDPRARCSPGRGGPADRCRRAPECGGGGPWPGGALVRPRLRGLLVPVRGPPPPSWTRSPRRTRRSCR